MPMTETKITGRLPGLDIEITQRASPHGRGEMVAISLQAVPDLTSAAARLAPLLPALLMAPLGARNNAVLPVFMPMMAWTAWLNAAQAWTPLLALNPFLAPFLPRTQVDEKPGASHVK